MNSLLFNMVFVLLLFLGQPGPLFLAEKAQSIFAMMRLNCEQHIHLGIDHLAHPLFTMGV